MSTPDDNAALDLSAMPALKKKKEALIAARAATDGPSTSELTGASVTINRPKDEVFAYWRDFQHLPEFLETLERVEVLDDRRSRWVFEGLLGSSVKLEAVIKEEIEGELLVWGAPDGAKVEHSGRVEFHDAGERGTIVSAVITYDPPGGAVGELAAKLFQQDPETQTRRDLRRFKQLMETGEVATSARTRAELIEEKS